MATLQYLMANKIIPIKSSIHDCVDNSAVETLLAGTRNLRTNNALAYEYRSGDTDLWDEVTSTVKDTILDSKMDIIIGGTMNAPSANTRMMVELVIPDPGGEILVKSRTLEVSRNGVDIHVDMSFLVYNGAAALTHGFQVYLSPIGGNIDISNKAILVRV